MTCMTMTLKARTDRRLIRSTSRSARFVLAEITAPHSHRQQGQRRPPVNLAFVLDRSGSMAGDKIRLAKEAVAQSLRRLDSDDRFSVVMYDSEIDVVMASTPATSQARQTALTRLAMIDARSSTNLAGGWLRGAEQVALAMASEGVNRVLLLTDGLANVGITDPDQLTRHATELRARGIATTTFGVGADFDESLLQAMATAGGGNFYYIADEAAIADYVTSEVGEALDVVAREVALEITAPESVSIETLTPFPFERRGARTVVQLGSLVAEQLVQVVLRLSFPLGEVGHETGVVVSLSDATGVAGGAAQALDWRYADHAANDGQERDVEVDRAVASVYAARARQEATRLNKATDYEAARQALAAVARRIRDYAGRDAELRGIIAELERDAESLSAPMAPVALKQMHFASYASARMRMPSGAAMRAKGRSRTQ
jgi:Ca-activated chloride channel family protein